MGRFALHSVLCEWQKHRLRSVHSENVDYRRGPESVTVLAYYWGVETRQDDSQFFRIESAFRETWLHCGMMKSVIVTDCITHDMQVFASRFPAVEIQVEPGLIPGDIASMSRDCDEKLVTRFSTEYVLIIQDDGFPLRSGLQEFLGRWDFVGAPYVRDKLIPRLIAKTFNLWACNGGFSLRTHRICEMASACFKNKWHACRDQRKLSDDVYYTETLLQHEWRYNRTMRMCDNRNAIRFAWDSIVPFEVMALPFGFHRAETFVDLLRRGWVK